MSRNPVVGRVETILVLSVLTFILASGCLSEAEKEYTGEELNDIALADPGVVSLTDGREYSIVDNGPAELNGENVFYVKLSIDNGGERPIPYSVFINKAGQVILISKEFPAVDPADFKH